MARSPRQASWPHLHFHLADADQPLGAEGLPYRLAGAQVIGRYPSIAAFEQGEAWQAHAATLMTAFPAPNVVITFDSAPPRQGSRK